MRQIQSGHLDKSHNEVVTAADIASWLGLPGNRAEVMRTCRNKELTRAVTAGLRFGAVTDAASVATGVERVGLPCVVKPVDDSGSHNVRLRVSLEEAREQVERIISVDVDVRSQPTAKTALLEEYLDGREDSVELSASRTVTSVVPKADARPVTFACGCSTSSRYTRWTSGLIPSDRGMTYDLQVGAN